MKTLILGGNRFFGRHLAQQLLDSGADVTLLNRGNLDDQFGDKIQRIKADRQNLESMEQALPGTEWDVVYDQICYTADEAALACKVFAGKTKRYVVTSSESVFDDGVQLKESAFDPKQYRFDQVADRFKNYQEAKRQVEVVFTNKAPFDVAIVRPSLVVGLDDYTDRLKWHVNRIAQSLPIYFPNLDSRSDFILSDQAAMALKIVGESKHTGPFNCTTPGTLALRELVSLCEEATGKKAVLADSDDGTNHSPYGGVAEKSMNTALLQSLGFNAPSSREWMRTLITQISQDSQRTGP